MPKQTFLCLSVPSQMSSLKLQAMVYGLTEGWRASMLSCCVVCTHFSARENAHFINNSINICINKSSGQWTQPGFGVRISPPLCVYGVTVFLAFLPADWKYTFKWYLYTHTPDTQGWGHMGVQPAAPEVRGLPCCCYHCFLILCIFATIVLEQYRVAW